MTQLVSSIFYHTSQHILWEKRRQTGTSAMNFYRWTCSWFLSPLSSPVEGTTESFKIMLRYFHLPAIKRVWPLHLWIKVLILEFCSVNNLEFGQTPINTFWSWNLMSPTSLPSAALNSQFFCKHKELQSLCRTKKNDNKGAIMDLLDCHTRTQLTKP